MRMCIANIAVVLVIAVCAGCKQELDGVVGAPIALERKYAERSYEFAFGSSNRVFTLKANMEYPSPYGVISVDEYARLTGFVNELFNGGSNFVTTVDEVSRDVFKEIRQASTNVNFNADDNLNMEIVGRVSYADARYFSYELDFRSLGVVSLRCTYDRSLARSITIDDLAQSNCVGRLRGYIRDHIKSICCSTEEGLFKDRPKDWPMVKDTFTLDEYGLTLNYSKEELGIGSRMEILIGWDQLKSIVNPSVLPPGKYTTASARHVAREDSDWWKFPFERFVRMKTVPPNPPFVGTNYPYAEVRLNVESPCQGGMALRKFEAIQKCLAHAMAHHKGTRCETIADAVHAQVVHFWEMQIKNWDGKPPDSGFGIYELQTRIAYRGPEYVSFKIDSQNGCPCCSETTNLVWCWSTQSPLHIDGVIEMTATNELKRLMRNRVIEDLEDDYKENPGFVLPDYANEWPYSFDNFSLDTRGVTWFCNAGEVLFGGKGSYETFLSWKELSPVLKKGFVIPKK